MYVAGEDALAPRVPAVVEYLARPPSFSKDRADRDVGACRAKFQYYDWITGTYVTTYSGRQRNWTLLRTSPIVDFSDSLRLSGAEMSRCASSLDFSMSMIG